MTRPRTAGFALLMLSCALVISACGTTTVTRASEVNLVRKGLAVANAGPAKSIDCPSDVPAKVGKTLDCHVKLARGGSVTFTLRVDQISGDKGHMTIVGVKQQ